MADLRQSKTHAKQLELLRKQETQRGLLIAFEGPDGAGKSTQRKLFKKWLESEGHEVVTTKPLSSPLVKPLIKARKAARALSPQEFCLLEAAEFRHRLETEVLPALWSGKSVVSEHHLFTCFARDAARGLPLDWQLSVYTPLFWPDIVFYFDISFDNAIERATAEGKLKFYQSGQDVTGLQDRLASYKKFLERLLQEYRSLSVMFDAKAVRADQSIYAVHRELRDVFRQSRKRPWTESNADAVIEWLGRK